MWWIGVGYGGVWFGKVRSGLVGSGEVLYLGELNGNYIVV